MWNLYQTGNDFRSRVKARYKTDRRHIEILKNREVKKRVSD